MTTPDEYRQLTTKEIEVPSGATFTIRKLPPKAMLILWGIMEEEGFEAGSEGDFGKALMKHYEELNRDILPNFVVSPKLASANPAPEGFLSAGELSWEDSISLITAGFEFSGMTKEEEEARESFREPSGADASQPSDDISSEAEQLPAEP